MPIDKNNVIVIVIAGATASGKSAVALYLAKKMGGVVINADSVQLYDGLHMLTAHPSKEEQSQAPHKLYGVLPADSADTCSAAKWRDMALLEIDSAIAMGMVPIIVGGSGFYIKSLIEGLSPIPEVPKEIRQKVTLMLDEMGREELAEYLANRDKEIINRIDINNPARVMRALEVLEATGKSLSYWQDMPKENVREDLNFIEIVIRPDREILYERCNLRFEFMVKNGALEEVEEFLSMIDSGIVAEDSPLTRALGFWELADYISGNCSLEEAIAEAQKVTRNYAKRQTTWFKNQIKEPILLNSIDEANLENILLNHLPL